MFWQKIWYDEDWKREKWVVIAIFIGIILTTGVHFYSQSSIRNSIADDGELKRDYLLSSQLQELENNLLEMEKYMRSYILSGNHSFFNQFNRCILETDRRFAEIEQILLKDKLKVGGDFQNVQKAIQAKINFNNALIDSFEERGKTTIQFSNKEQQEKNLNLTISTTIAAFQETHEIDIEDKQSTINASDRRSLLVDNLAFIIGAFLLVMALIYLIRSLQKRLLLHEELVQAKVRSEKNANIKEQFLANMSHEIRTPLQAILGYSNILNKENLNDKQTEYVNTIRTASENLLSIVNDILDVSKIESSMILLESIPFSVSGLLHSLDNMFQIKVNEKDVYLKLHPNPKIPDILVGDPTRLTQILVNLINNAIKFTDNGGVDIFIDLVEKSNRGVKVKFSIKDSGIGIPKDKLNNIFDRFEQVDAKVTREFGGSGLGLYIVNQLVKRQDGQVEVESKKGVGSTFSVTIPYQIADEKEMQLVKSSSRIDLNYSFENIKLLLVEDNLMNQRVVGIFLSEWGFDYDLAENGKIAIRLLEQNKYDLVLMDVQMPEMDGYSATEYIRQVLKLKTPIIAMTAHALAGEKEKALSHGMNEYISKPIREENLFKLIARFIPLKKDLDSLPKSNNNNAPSAKQNDVAEIIINYNYLIQSSNGKKDYLNSILQIFLQQAPVEMDVLVKALNEKNFDLVGKTAHSLKSTIGYIGLEGSIFTILEEIENVARENPSLSKLEPITLKLADLIEKAIMKVETEAIPLVQNN